MDIAIGSDHAGFEMKQALIDYLNKNGHAVTDCGPENDDRVDYPDYAVPVCELVAAGKVQRGVLVCGTGIGMAISACKIPGIRAANAIVPEFAHLAREHNDANVITLSGRFVSEETNQAILNEFLTTEFAGGRHEGRVQKINALDSRKA